VPAAPTYATDVKPIFMARCTRCHGETLRGETLANGVVRPPPSYCHLDRYDSTGDCSDAGIVAKACIVGAGLCTVKFQLRGRAIPSASNGFTTSMPPDPAPELDHWEVEVVTAWLDKVDSSGMPAP
jgi:hypothetical protein